MGTTRICLTHGSADRLLEHCAVTGVELEPSELCPQDFRADASLAHEVLDGLYGTSTEWLNLLVGHQRDRRNSASVSSFCFEGRLPPKSILRYDEGVYVASPNFNLLLQSSQLHLVQLAQMLGRYWGTYSSEVDRDGFPIERAPLTTELELAHYLRGLKGLHGLTRLREAMRHTCASAASPQEVNLQLLLCLPPACNGYALRKPTMNRKIDLGARAQAFYPVESIRVDLCWKEEGFGLEYLGEKEHAGRVVEDVSRWYAAREKGIELWYVTKAQLQDACAMNVIAREVARRTGKRVMERTWPTIGETQDLIDVLVRARNIGPIDRLRTRALRVKSTSR